MLWGTLFFRCCKVDCISFTSEPRLTRFRTSSPAVWAIEAVDDAKKNKQDASIAMGKQSINLTPTALPYKDLARRGFRGPESCSNPSSLIVLFAGLRGDVLDSMPAARMIRHVFNTSNEALLGGFPRLEALEQSQMILPWN